MNNLFVLLRQRGETYCGIDGYSDDNLLIAPSLHALQCMLETCEEYAAAHNFIFSTDPNPIMCKTKCLAFTSKKTELPLSWVDHCKHLGNSIQNQYDGIKQDLLTKQANIASQCFEKQI